jgi:hypothetical protein
MRTLEFTKDDKGKYDLIYEGFVLTSRPMQGGDIRVVAKIFDKLETLGRYDEENSNKNRNLFIFDKPGKISFEEPEFILLKDALTKVQFNTSGARKAAPIMEWLESIPEDKVALVK